MTTLKAPFPYYGGKSRVAGDIVRLMPAHRHYVEPFFGAGSVLLAKPPIVMETANDLNGDIVHFFAVLRDRPEDLARVCGLTPHSRDEHAMSFDRDGVEELERARRIFVNLSQGRNASLRKTGWAHFQNPGNMSATGSRPRYLQSMVGRFAEISERLLNVSWEHRDGLEVIEAYGAHADVLLYVDPPYLSTTRSSRGYAAEFDSTEQHSALLEVILKCDAAVMLSGYDSPLYRDALEGWYVHEIGGARDARGSSRREFVWANRPASDRLFDEAIA